MPKGGGAFRRPIYNVSFAVAEAPYEPAALAVAPTEPGVDGKLGQDLPLPPLPAPVSARRLSRATVAGVCSSSKHQDRATEASRTKLTSGLR